MKSSSPRRLHPSATLRSSTIIFHPSSQSRQRHQPLSSASATGGGNASSIPRPVPRRPITAPRSPLLSATSFVLFFPTPVNSFHPLPFPTVHRRDSTLLSSFLNQSALLLSSFLFFPFPFPPFFALQSSNLTSLAFSKSSRNLSARDPRVTHPLPTHTPDIHKRKRAREDEITDRAHASLPYL